MGSIPNSNGAKMLVNAELYVKDFPGQLIASLEPVSMVDGNIVGVVHNRDRIVNQRICVNVTIEVRDSKTLDRLKKLWKERDVLITSIGSVYNTCSMEYLLLGQFSASTIEKMIDEASEVVKFESVGVSYSTANSTNRRTAMITAEVLSTGDLDKLDAFFIDSCKKNGIIYIRGL